jgi:hypothetical protein
MPHAAVLQQRSRAPSGCTAQYVRQNTIHFHTISTSVPFAQLFLQWAQSRPPNPVKCPACMLLLRASPRSSGSTQTPVRLSCDKNRTAMANLHSHPTSFSLLADPLDPSCCLFCFSDAAGLLSTPRISLEEPEQSVNGAQLARQAHLPSKSSDKCFTSPAPFCLVMMEKCATPASQSAEKSWKRS